MAKAKTKVAAKKAPVVKKVEEPVVQEKVEEPVVEEKTAVQETKTEEVTHTIYNRNIDILSTLVNEFVSKNVKSGNLVSVVKRYNPDREQREATIVYKK